MWFMDRRSKHIKQYPFKSLAYDDLFKALCIFRRDIDGRYPDKMIGDHDFKLIAGQVAAALEGDSVLDSYEEQEF